MRGDSEIIACLNALLSYELTAIDQYFVQSRMFADWGYGKLHDRIDHEAEDERGHADKLVRRILYLDGQPDVGARAPLNIGTSPQEMLANDLAFETEVAKALNEAIALCREQGDNGSRELLEELLHDTEMDHILWFRQQVDLIESLGVESYLQEQI